MSQERNIRIGGFVLDTLTTGMYTNSLDTVREYVQNSYDAIREAESKGLLAQRAGRIKITVDDKERSLLIEDNGTGIPVDDFVKRLLDIGLSEKDLKSDTGFRGIGRLAGIAYCERLEFSAKASEENVESRLMIDCEKLKHSMSPFDKSDDDLSSLMARNTKIETIPNKSNNHFFRVTMQGISQETPELLSRNSIEGYLSEVAPVEFDAQRFVFAKKIEEWLNENDLKLPHVTIIIKATDGERQVFKPYRTHYKTRDYRLEIRDIKFYLGMRDDEKLFWVWYGSSDLLGMIEDSRSAGIRLRKNNMSIGGAQRINEIFYQIAPSNERFNSYYIGEAHIISNQAVPNARRDGFEELGQWPNIKNDLKDLFVSLCKEVREASSARNRPMQKIRAQTEKVIEDAKNSQNQGFCSDDEVVKIRDKLKKEVEIVEKAKEGRNKKEELEELGKISENLRSTLNSLDTPNFVAKRLRSELDKKQRKLVSEILKLLMVTLDPNNYRLAKEAILGKYGLTKEDET